MMSEKYLDYVFLIVNPQQKITDYVKMYINLSNFMYLPVISIVTMADSVTSDELDVFIKQYKQVIKSSHVKKNPMIVYSIEDILLFSRNMNEAIHPIFIVFN